MRLAVAMNDTTVTATDIRRDFRTVLDDIIRGKHVTVTNHDRPCAVIVSPEWYAAAAEALLYSAGDQDAADYGTTPGSE